jgi:hypothetical protein
MVTVDPVAKLKLAVSETVSVLVAPGTGVLCWIHVQLNLGSTTVSGSAPLATPCSAVPGFVMAADAMAAVPDAAMFIVGDVVALAGLVIWNLNVYVLDTSKLAPLFTVSVKFPESHSPFPSEKIVSPSSPASSNVMGFDATAPASPDTVTAEPSEAANAESDTRVTVIVLLAPAAGLLWPIALVVKDSALERGQQLSRDRSKSVSSAALFVAPIPPIK